MRATAVSVRARRRDRADVLNGLRFTQGSADRRARLFGWTRVNGSAEEEKGRAAERQDRLVGQAQTNEALERIERRLTEIEAQLRNSG
jgi:glutathione S-transferase